MASWINFVSEITSYVHKVWEKKRRNEQDFEDELAQGLSLYFCHTLESVTQEILCHLGQGRARVSWFVAAKTTLRAILRKQCKTLLCIALIFLAADWGWTELVGLIIGLTVWWTMLPCIINCLGGCEVLLCDNTCWLINYLNRCMWLKKSPRSIQGWSILNVYIFSSI